MPEPDPTNLQPAFALNVTDWKPGEERVIDSRSEGIPFPLAELKPGYYKIAAILDVNEEERMFNLSPGNVYSRQETLLQVTPQGPNEAVLVLNAVVRERPFRETERVKYLNLQSSLLTAFHRKPVFVKAGVILPKSYATSGKRYPVVYIIPGWTGTHFDALGNLPKTRYGTELGEEKIFVYLNPESQTRWGLHAFVDSRVNGPWGKALVEEVIPFVQAHYRAETSSRLTFLVGQSSGGYAALWLHLHYPKAFGGSWGVSPDPVSFRSFTGIDLYRDKNYYTDALGKERALFKVEGRYLMTLRRAMQVEEFTGDGGQQQSFEAEFGVWDKDGKPARLFNRKSGVIDRSVVQAWKPYDLTLFLRQNWKRLAPLINNGSIHVYAGGEDNFRLNESVADLQKTLSALQARIVAEVIPGATHWSVWSPSFTARVQAEIDRLIEAAR